MESINMKRSRLWLLFGVVAVIALGLASRKFPSLFPALLGKYPGDALWALMVFLGWAFCKPRASTRNIAALAFATSCLVEFSQLYQADWLRAIRSTTLGHLVLGSTFSWFDIAAYAVGILAGVLIDAVCFCTSGFAADKRQTAHSAENPGNPHVYDKAKYHHESIEEFGLPDEHASNHTVPILRWLIENQLMSEFFLTECADELSRFRKGRMSIHELYGRWDRCLISDMLSEQGNAFAMHYFDFEKGAYLKDYCATLQGTLPSEFHVAYSDENYRRLKPLMDAAYAHWAASIATVVKLS